MKWDVPAIEAAFEKGLSLVETLAPLAAVAGPGGAAAGQVMSDVAEGLSDLLTEVGADAEILASGDLSKIRDLQKQIQDENDKLESQVEAS